MQARAGGAGSVAGRPAVRERCDVSCRGRRQRVSVLRAVLQVNAAAALQVRHRRHGWRSRRSGGPAAQPWSREGSGANMRTRRSCIVRPRGGLPGRGGVRQGRGQGGPRVGPGGRLPGESRATPARTPPKGRALDLIRAGSSRTVQLRACFSVHVTTRGNFRIVSCFRPARNW